ncbi:ABC transporter permease [Pseudogracilibacillus auburnensis]|uniref:Peptide/nickel transport system permease protein n=1 Tax=Pseudogracilibacillus auburnensis TaxID=1494959 RepID=A0A2V3W153_9BACI|nr:ABC transporter permease [Pseudogracilibacillus auburnensis]MBO1001754.1 ABC transporter permease [Pseudogracilibacillus auburnensis]PXW85985.1 peptide/nickel transport system permease protein [Pseudogracilibacillus auburnensis]
MGEFLTRLRNDKIGLMGLIGVLLICIIGLLAPFIAPHNPTEIFNEYRLVSPNSQFLLGTDDLGRDILSRIIYGAQVSLMVGLIAVGIGAGFGLLFGLLAGYFQGVIDNIIMRVMDVLFAFPDLLLALAIVAVLGPNLKNTMIAIGLVFIPVFTRLVRSSVISVKEMEYVTNAKSIGASHFRIIVRHLTPNILAPFLVQITLALSSAILAEAALSFLGLGIQPPDPSWGSMLNTSRKFMEIAPWTAIFPAVFIIFTIFCFNLLGDSLRDIFDPRLKDQ